MHGQLEEYLNALRRNECYRTDAVLKRSAYETTERVFFVGHNGAERGPYVRKRFAADSGMGDAYERLWEAQERGQRFVHLPRILECYDTESERVVVMEHVGGETLADVVYRCDPSVVLGVDVLRKLCDAVAELHERFDPPLIHRDLKPSNIMLSSAGLTIIDFGIARSFDPDRTEDTRHLGTRNYAPPEQFGFGQTSVRSDIYSMGMVLYYCLTEKVPSASLAGSGFVDAAIPVALRPLLAKATRFDPQQRYESVAEMRQDLERAVAALHVPEPASLPEVAMSLAPPEGHVPAIPADAPSPSGDMPVLLPAQVGEVSLANGGARVDEARSAAEARDAKRGRVDAGSGPSGARERVRPLAVVPRWVGLLWDTLLIAVWVLFQIANVLIILDPQGTLASYEPWGRWCMGIGVITIPFALIAYGLADKRPLEKRFPVLERWRWSVQLVLCVVAAVVTAFFTGFVCLLAVA